MKIEDQEKLTKIFRSLGEEYMALHKQFFASKLPLYKNNFVLYTQDGNFAICSINIHDEKLTVHRVETAYPASYQPLLDWASKNMVD